MYVDTKAVCYQKKVLLWLQILLPFSYVFDVGRMQSPLVYVSELGIPLTTTTAHYKGALRQFSFVLDLRCYFLPGSPRDSPWDLGRVVIGKDISERVRI